MDLFENDLVLAYCEKYGIYQPYKVKGNVMTYYEFYPSAGYERACFVKVVVNVKTGKEERKILRYRKTPKFLIGRYNYIG